MANLYTQADSNIRKTWFYLFLFALIIIGVGWMISFFFEKPILLWIAAIFAIMTNFFAYWYSDKIVLRMTNAKPIEKNDNPELYRLLENLSITAGLPMPKLYIIEESQPNAFATGRDPKHGVIAVTRGLLDKLDRTEIEGVLAHELAHIGNRDILLSTVVVVLVGMIVIVADFSMRIALSGGGRGDNRGSGGGFMIIVYLIALGVAIFFAQVMKMAISRKREFLADSSGALLTRYPDGLARALEKISNDPNPIRNISDATAHLYISNPLRGDKKMSRFHRLFMTHPPTEERIKTLRGI